MSIKVQYNLNWDESVGRSCFLLASHIKLEMSGADSQGGANQGKSPENIKMGFLILTQDLFK